MSALTVVKVSGDIDRFRQALLERGDEFAKIAEEAKSKGALHHRFGIGDGFVLVLDEWQEADVFMQFFSNPELQTFIASVGGETSTPPDITVTRRSPRPTSSEARSSSARPRPSSPAVASGRHQF